MRTAGFSLAYSLATTIGGSTPAIVTALIHATGNRAMPGAWLAVAAAIALIAILIGGNVGYLLPSKSYLTPKR